jgi:hypothetical protein
VGCICRGKKSDNHEAKKIPDKSHKNPFFKSIAVLYRIGPQNIQINGQTNYVSGQLSAISYQRKA